MTAILRQSVDQIIELMDIPRDSELPFLTENLDLDSDLDDSDIDLQELADKQLHHETENMPSSNTLSGKNIMPTSESTDSHLPMLSTLEKMSELIFSEMLESDLLPANEKKIPTRLIIDDLSEINIVSEPCQQILSDCGIHFAAFAAAFTTDIQHGHEQFKHLHNDQLPSSSEN